MNSVTELSLRRLLDRRRDGPRAAARELWEALIDLCESLAERHAQGELCHRLAPEEVRLGPSRSIEIRLLEEAEVAPALPPRAVRGLGYLAPEVLREGLARDARADLFSVGAIVYEALTGQRAFPGGTPLEIKLATLTASPRPPREVCACSEALSALCMRLLSRDPEQRPGSAREVAEALRSSSPALDPGPAPTAPEAAPRAAPVRSRELDSTMPAPHAGEGDAPAAKELDSTMPAPHAARGNAPAARVPDSESGELPSAAEGLPRPIRERFSDIRFLGQGGMGAVYRATDRQLRRDVALKLLHDRDPRANERVLREARAQARVEHEHVCKIHEVGVAEGRAYIVMEHVDGEPLSEMTERLTLEEKVKVVRDAAAALHEAHRLGLVHRDVKPGNILVGRTTDGAYKPYVVDFGLAREAGEQGQTMTGDVLGTPAFMAPEQARGEIRALDRRTDVYGLGATLYDLIAGHPPFTAPSLAQLLERVLREDAPPLAEACPAVPEDLNTIVMKCLDRDPRRRYESARALCDDLQRYLDGEPVLARRASLAYVLGKRARKHRLLLSLLGVSLAAAMVLVGGWVRQRRLAAEEAMVARELGEAVKEMQMFLRAAYELPLHDVGRERKVVRQRLAEIERTMAAAGRAAEGPGSEALGRGYLSLGEPDRALSYMQRASAAGYASPELDFAMGLSLVELYKVAREELPRIVDPGKRAARQKEIDEKYRDPALRHLKAARGTRLDHPAYVEGLIALYEGRHDEALSKAKQVQTEAPWLYEAWLLEGDIQFAQGNRWRHDAEFDNDKMMQHYRPALDAYRSAADAARSDPAAHAGACDVWTQIAFAEFSLGKLPKESFEEAKLSCGRAIEASPETSATYIKRAFAHYPFSAAALYFDPHPEKVIEAAIAGAEDAARRNPESAFAHYLVGGAWGHAAMHALTAGNDVLPLSNRAIAAYEEAIRLDPGFLWAVTELCGAHEVRATQESVRGLDPEPSFRRARELLDRADQIAPGFVQNAVNRGLRAGDVASHLLARGQSPAAAVEEGVAAYSSVIERGPEKCFAYLDRAHLHVLAARYAIASGADPRPSLDRAEESVRRMPCPEPPYLGTTGIMRATTARAALLRGEDPGPELAQARELLRRAVQDEPNNLELVAELVGAEVTGIRWAMMQRKATPAMFEAAFLPLRPLLGQERVDPILYDAMAESHALRAAWLAESGTDPAEDLSEGLAMAEKALSKNPHLASAYATRGLLHLISARRARDPRAAREAAGRAREALLSAFKENPLLEREHGAALREAERLEQAPAGRVARR
jgi:serine/threonine-protein kinase